MCIMPPSIRAFKHRPVNPKRKVDERVEPYIRANKKKEPVEGKYLNLTYADEIKNVSASFRR